MNFKQAEQAFQSDPVFRALVLSIEAGIHQMNYTPGEVRAAAMFAAYRFECSRPRTYLYPSSPVIQKENLNVPS